MPNKRDKFIIIHSGTQHAFRLANALKLGLLNKKIVLYTWFILSKHSKFSNLSLFKNRVYDIEKDISIKIFPIFEILLILNRKIKQIIKCPTNNNPYYFWQTIFGYFLLPFLFYHKKKITLIVFETCGWPIVKYAKKWKIPVVMDFSAISHEAATKLGIKETKFGIKIKTLERQFIDYGLNCSAFAASTYQGKTSAKKHYPILLGTDFRLNKQLEIHFTHSEFIGCCIGNSFEIKGIDILLKAFDKIKHKNKKLYIIGNINKDLIASYAIQNQIALNEIVITGKINHSNLAQFLQEKRIQLHILPSRFDSFGMVVPETMALGIPNILSPFVGAGEMITDEVDGYLMETLDVNALYKCIEKYLFLTDIERKKLYKNVLRKAKKMTWRNYNRHIKDTFDEISMSINGN